MLKKFTTILSRERNSRFKSMIDRPSSIVLSACFLLGAVFMMMIEANLFSLKSPIMIYYSLLLAASIGLLGCFLKVKIDDEKFEKKNIEDVGKFFSNPDHLEAFYVELSVYKLTGLKETFQELFYKIKSPDFGIILIEKLTPYLEAIEKRHGKEEVAYSHFMKEVKDITSYL